MDTKGRWSAIALGASLLMLTHRAAAEPTETTTTRASADDSTAQATSGSSSDTEIPDQGTLPPRRSALKTAAYVTWATVPISAAVFLRFALRSEALERQARDECGGEANCTAERRAELVDRVERQHSAANVALVTGVVGAVGGTVLYVLAPKRPKAIAGLEVSPTAGGAWISYRASF